MSQGSSETADAENGMDNKSASGFADFRFANLQRPAPTSITQILVSLSLSTLARPFRSWISAHRKSQNPPVVLHR